MATNPSTDSRTDLIKDIQERAKFWDAIATSDCIEAVRKRDQDDAASYLQRAAVSLARADACEKLSGEVIDLVHKHWPN